MEVRELTRRKGRAGDGVDMGHRPHALDVDADLFTAADHGADRERIGMGEIESQGSVGVGQHGLASRNA